MDILLTTFIANAVVLLSLLQDRGYKKVKYKHGTAKAGFTGRGVTGGAERNASRPITRWGSDENLMRISEGEGERKIELIGMNNLKLDKETPIIFVSKEGSDVPERPEIARLQDIRVTREVRVETD